MTSDNGRILGPDNTPTTAVASGVWGLDELYEARLGNIWPIPSVQVEYVIVGGGGGGAGGGGGGGFFSQTSTVINLGSYSVTVGAGGTASNAALDTATDGFGSTFITSVNGGLRGRGSSVTPQSGGNGGSGGGGYGTATLVGGAGGSDGGNGSPGGGATRDGGTGQGTTTKETLTPSELLRSGGGGGGTAGTGGAGGAGGGGAGGSGTGVGTSGTANTGGGGGGGGGGGASNDGGAGGSGVVIIRYADTFQDLEIGAGLQYADSGGVTQNGAGTRVAPSYSPTGFKVYEFRGGTGNVTF